jgi:dTDP-4-amino-4,6-dideoxygalactose transaminase
MNDTAFSGGPYVEQFEKEFAHYCGVKHAVAVNSGTAALHLAMLALGVQGGDEVIVPANTYIATAWGVSHAGAIPVFADCDALSWNVDPGIIEAKITSKTKAIIGVHLYGQPCDINSLLSISKKYGIHFIEDAAQAHGAKYEGKRAGSFGEMACFSFYPGKNLGAYGEGGGIVTNNATLAEYLKLLRNQGSREKYYHEVIGYNERMDGIQGAILSVKLKYLEEWNTQRQQIAKIYHEGITHTDVIMQKPIQKSESVYHLFVATVNNRPAMMKHLNHHNIFPGTHYPLPIHLQKAYAQLGHKKGDFPNSEYLSDHCLSLPMFPELTDEEVQYVIDTVNEYQA